jgi:hypothetical protein
MAKKDQDQGEDTITVRLANGHMTSLGAHNPGDEVELPEAEARVLLDAGYAARVGTVADDRMAVPDARGKGNRPPREADR